METNLALPETPASNNLQFPPLDQVTRTILTTEEAAHYLNRRTQTLRAWACLENGALRPVRINGRLAWNVSEIRNLLSGGEK